MPFLEADRQAGRIDHVPAPEELRPLVPIIQERLPTLGSIGELIGLERDRAGRSVDGRACHSQGIERRRPIPALRHEDCRVEGNLVLP